MDRTKLMEKLKSFRKPLFKWGAVACAVFALYGGYKSFTKMQPKGKGLVHSSKSFLSVKELFEIYANAYESVQHKIAVVRSAIEDSERLKMENATLRLKVEALKYTSKADASLKLTQQYQRKLASETGSRVGRTLASIQYRPPMHLTPEQVYALGVTYFKAREDEKAAVIFSELTNLEENETYKNSKTYLMAGIAWYRLENFEMADQYLEKAMAIPASTETLRYHAQARLWKALSAVRVGKQTKAQYWMRDLLDHHPHSLEARWINPVYSNKEANRATASAH